MYSYIYSESCTWKFPMPLSSSSCSSLCSSPCHVTVFYSEHHHQYLTSLSSYCCSQMKSSRGSLCWDTKARTFLERATKIFISDSQIRPQCQQRRYLAFEKVHIQRKIVSLVSGNLYSDIPSHQSGC